MHGRRRVPPLHGDAKIAVLEVPSASLLVRAQRAVLFPYPVRCQFTKRKFQSIYDLPG